MRKKKLMFISQFAHPGTYRKETWRRVLGGDDETEAMRALLDSIGVLEGINYLGVKAHEGEPISLHDDIDAVILGGSFASVADSHEWQAAIHRWLADWRATGKPLLGICGGHQLMACHLGARVERIPQGPEVGSLSVDLTPQGSGHYLFRDLGEAPSFFFGNFERVVDTGPSTIVLATRDHLPNAALDHGGNWVSVQFHPETTCDRMATCWAEIDPSRAAVYRFIPGCEKMIENFLFEHAIYRGTP